jgi:hypothetical protein
MVACLHGFSPNISFLPKKKEKKTGFGPSNISFTTETPDAEHT